MTSNGRIRDTGRRWLSLLLCVCLLFACAACSDSPVGQAFRYDVPAPIDNLDPQFVTDATALMILPHLYEGLVVSGAEGEVHPGVAERYTVSDDLTTYTFHLREDAVWPARNDKEWPGGDAVVAEDFVFSFLRIFRDGSPHAWKYAAVLGADAVISGDADQLPGVSARDARTLVFTLEQPDPLFLERLTEPAAAPCNRAAYTLSRGRYGLEPAYVYGNGPFEISRWDDVRLSLSGRESYRSARETVAGAVHFYIGRDAAEQFLDGKTDLAMLSREQTEQYGALRAEITPIQKTVWCIVFNQNHPVWGNALLRQAFAQAIDRDQIGALMSGSRQPSALLVPGAIRVMCKPYRELSAAVSPYTFDPDQARRLFSLGLANIGMKQLPGGAAILIPQEVKDSDAISSLQQGWQKHLSAYVNFDVNSAADIQTRLRAGDFQMLMMPMTPATDNITTLLDAFSSGSGQNHYGYSSPLYDELIAAASEQSTPELAAARYAQAETLLLADAVVIPLCFETSYLAVAEGVQDLEISSFGDRIFFKYAQRNS